MIENGPLHKGHKGLADNAVKSDAHFKWKECLQTKVWVQACEASDCNAFSASKGSKQTPQRSFSAN
jgi:hypothetical protein